jgi:choline kinase
MALVPIRIKKWNANAYNNAISIAHYEGSSFMNLVICMAGKNTRFHDLGYELPKYLLPIGGKTLIYKILENLNRDKIFQNIYLIPHERDRHFYPELMVSHFHRFCSTQHFKQTSVETFSAS